MNVFFPTTTFTVKGETRTYKSVADSGNIILRRFCPECGTPLFTAAEARPHLIGVRVGTLDDPNLVEPAMTIWTASAPPLGVHIGLDTARGARAATSGVARRAMMQALFGRGLSGARDLAQAVTPRLLRHLALLPGGDNCTKILPRSKTRVNINTGRCWSKAAQVTRSTCLRRSSGPAKN